MSLLPVLLTLMLASSQPQPSITPDELQGEAWLITHGIYVSQWKDPACRTLALSLADEASMTRERLAFARKLAENAQAVQGCNTDSERPSDVFSPG